MPPYEVKSGQVFELNNGRGTPVEVLKVNKGQVFYFRTEGSGVIHSLSEDDFLRIYTIDYVKEAQIRFKKELKEILEDGN